MTLNPLAFDNLRTFDHRAVPVLGIEASASLAFSSSSQAEAAPLRSNSTITMINGDLNKRFSLSSAILALFFTAVTVLADNHYPDCAQNNWAALPPSCASVTDDYAAAHCTCPDKTWLSDSAYDIYSACGCDVLIQTASDVVANCQGLGVDSALDAQEFIDVGAGKGQCGRGSATTAASPTTTSDAPSPVTSKAEPTKDPAVGLQKKGNQIALGCGVAAIVVAIIIGISCSRR